MSSVVPFQRKPADRRKPLPTEGRQPPLKPVLAEEDVSNIVATQENLRELSRIAESFKSSDPNNSYQQTVMDQVLRTLTRMQRACTDDLTPDDA